MEKTIGGDRLGSGQKQTVEMHNYQMNSFNLEQDWKSSMAPGIIYPCLKVIGTNHGTFDIDIDSFVRTLPTKGPLFGSFKLQVDVFSVPFRLYQGILHNNPIGIGLNMNQVYLPKMELETVDYDGAPRVLGSNDDNFQVNESALLKYLGVSGWGRKAQPQSSGTAKRKLQCVPELAYYDIFKCYYSNKQEENAYVITPGTVTSYQPKNVKLYTLINDNWIEADQFTIYINTLEERQFKITGENFEDITNQAKIKFICLPGEGSSNARTLEYHKEEELITINSTKENEVIFSISLEQAKSIIDNYGDSDDNAINVILEDPAANIIPKYSADIALTPFTLKNIDDMRNALLSCNTIGTEFKLVDGDSGSAAEWGTDRGEDNTGLPYSALVKTTMDGITWNAFAQNGLVVKTYQSDLFNNWLATDFIDTITSMTTVDTSNGGFTMDTLNLYEKFYELLNRIIVGGGTYEDWQEAVYGEGAVRKAETPMYIGGMAAEVMFEEVISSSETKVDGDFQALGSLGGKGTQVGKRGGANIHCKCEEPSYIMAMVSLTPRICYSQGNDWDVTELDTLDDLHKPALDGIGFQDLMVEQMAWWDTVLRTTGGVLQRHSAGKQTAWINYQTAVDKCYGDFAKTDGYSFMVLNRNYEHGEQYASVKDISTYIDPAKYNYAFAVQDLASQNFWVQLHFKVTARRKMGAQQLPNL